MISKNNNISEDKYVRLNIRGKKSFTKGNVIYSQGSSSYLMRQMFLGYMENIQRKAESQRQCLVNTHRDAL